MEKNSNKMRKFIIPAIFVVVAIICVLLTPLVKINYNISDYLDDSSETKVSLNIMESEFGLNGSVQVMIRDIDVETANEVKNILSAIENVLIVNFDSQNENYYKNNTALFTVMTNGDEYSDTSRAVAAEIQETLNARFGDKVEYDGSVVEKLLLQKAIKSEVVLILVISLCLVALLMLITAESWLEPFILLLSSGFAVLINMGTNLIFGEISYITNAVASILQLALSIDYSIVLLHKYRAIKADNSEMDSETAMKSAVGAVLSPVSASALTTMAGLLALLFMSFRIGFDIGSVLMKSILISAITAMTLLPALLLIFEGLMQKTKKPALHVNGKIFTNFTFKFKKVIIPVAVVFIIAGAVLQSFNTYSFTDGSNKNKKLQEAFGNNNSVVVLYPNRADSDEKEAELKALLEAYENGDKEGVIKSFTAYSNTIGVQYSPEDAADMFGLPQSKAELLFKMYHLYADSAQVKLNVKEVLEYAADLIRSNDPDIQGYVTEDMAGAIDFFLYLESIMDTEYTADEFFTAVTSHEFVKDAMAEFPLSSLVIEQMYGMYVYDNNSSVANTKIQFSELIKFLCREITTAESFVYELGGVLGADFSEQVNEILTEDTKKLISTLEYLLDSMPAPGAKVTKTQFKEILGMIGVEGANDFAWQMAFGSAKEVTTEQFLGVVEKDFLNLILDLYDPVEDGEEPSKIRSLLKDYFFKSEGSGKNKTYPNYNKLYNFINGTYTYDQVLDSFVANDLDDYYKELTGNELSDVLGESVGIAITDMDVAVQQLYILYLNRNDMMPEAELSTRQLIDFTINKLESDAMLSKLLPEYVVGLLYDLIDLTEMMDDQTKYDYKELNAKVNDFIHTLDSFEISQSIDEGILMGAYVKYGIQNNLIRDGSVVAIDLVRFIYNSMNNNAILSGAMGEEAKGQLSDAYGMLVGVEDMLLGENYSRILVSVDLPVEGEESVKFVKYLIEKTKEVFGDDAHVAGEIVSTMEQKEVFNKDNVMISIITIVSIFLIILFTFKSISLPVILVAAIQGAIWISMSMSLVSGPMFFMSYIMATCILMGATIDYGILMSTNYVQGRQSMEKDEALRYAVDSTMPTIFTSGIILMICGLVVGIVASQMCIASVGFLLFRGTLISTIMISIVLPSLLYVLDKFVLKFTKSEPIDFKKLFKKQ